MMDFFVGWECVEKRLIPRGLVLQFLVAKGLIKKSFRNTAFFVRPEKKFLQEFVNPYAESPHILNLYRGEIGSFKMTDD